jgi:tetratricopeptide (TPR) repeat protein
MHALLDQALDLPPAERQAWLARLREEQPSDVTALEALLAAEPDLDAQGFLSGGAFADGQAPAGLAGQRLGAYTLESPLGQGGMGTVWLARRSDGRFEGRVAVKLLNLALIDPIGTERFRREGTVLARLSHANIARLLDAGVTDGGQPYLVLEHIEGTRIDRYCDEHRLARDGRLSLFLDVLEAVAHAHASLIVHRDLKPSNILVTAAGAVKLVDFGIAKLLEDDTSGAGTSTLTDVGGRALTLEYAAPEQVTGGAITTATDVYALGVLLYVLLSDRHPTAENCRTAGEIVRALEEVEPARLGLGDLDTILSKALRKAAGERYQMVTTLADDLRRYLQHQPVSARPASVRYRVTKFLRRNRAAVAAGTLAVSALIAATIFSVAQMQEARRQRDAAVLQRQRAGTQIEFQSLLMSQVGDRPITMREMVDHARRTLEQQYAGDPRFLGPILVEMSGRYAELGDIKAREAVLSRAESLVIAGRSDQHLAEIRCHQADNLRSQDRNAEARTAFQAADSLLRTTPDPRVEIKCLEYRAFFTSEVGPPEQSVTDIRRALAIMDSLGETESPAYLDLEGTLGGALQSVGRVREAMPVYDRIMAGFDRSGRGTLMASTIVRHEKALGLVKLGEMAEAERLFHEAVVRAARADPAGRVHPQPLIHYAETALAQGHADSALKYFGQLFARAVDDTSRYWQGRAAFGLARAQARLNRLADARRTTEIFRGLRADFPQLLRTDDQVPDTEILEGWMALARGDTAAAHARFLAALRTNGFFQGKWRARLRPVAIQAAETALSLGRPETALDLARQAREIATLDSLTEIRSARVGEARLIEGRALLAIGDTGAGRLALGRAVVALRFGAGDDHERSRQAAEWLAIAQRVSPRETDTGR